MGKQSDYSHYMKMSCDDLVMFYIVTQEGSFGWKLGHLTMTPELCLVTTCDYIGLKITIII